ncbi:MAG TPA: monothiol glutaredoxin, Grx4 family, partial [Kineobactrum sp.]
KGELIGGCDIVVEMAESGELQTLVKEAVATQGAS